MIDLLKNYKQLQHAPGYVGTLRYFLAKKKLDTLFVKWLSSNKQTVQQLLTKAEKGVLKASQQPNPLFLHHRVPLKNSMNMSASQMNFNNTITPPKIPQQLGQKRKNLHQTNINLAQSAYISKALVHQPIPTSEIPQFYFPKGKPLDNITQTSVRSQINAILGQNVQISIQMAKKLTCDVLGLPNYFSALIFTHFQSTNGIIKRTEFMELWKDLQNKDVQYRAFYLLSTDKRKKFCTIQDFNILFKEILEVHPGLEFLKDAPEFQDWYSLCVIRRMFFMANRKNDYQLSFREFKKSNILKSLCDIENQPDINRNTDFFSYQDFYVIYMKFWDLDNDHDFFLEKQQLSKYSTYTLSRKSCERIFSQVAKKFKDHPTKMSFGDFVWFILCVEDKASQRSLQYWFKIMDLDDNGIITGYQLEYFYQEQCQRLNYMDNTQDFNFQNIVCQMVDLLKPTNHIQFTLQNFLNKRSQASTFISMFIDLNRVIGFQNKDAYQQRDIKRDNPGWTEWDRFSKPQYKKIQNATEEDSGEVLNWENDD